LRRSGVVALLVAACVWAWGCALAGAVEAAEIDPAELLRRAEGAEAEGDIEGAIELYERVVAEAPAHRAASRALRRLPALRALLGPSSEVIQELEAVKRAYPGLGSDAAIAAVDALLARAEAGQVRVALHLWLANEYAWVRNEHDAARAHYLEAAWERGATEEQLADAWAGASRSSLSWRALNETRRALERFVATHPEHAAGIGADVLREDLGDRQVRIAASWVGAIALVMVALRFVGSRGWRAMRWRVLARWKPWRAGLFLAWTFGGAGVIAELWEHGNLLAFVACVPGVWAVYLTTGAVEWARTAASGAEGGTDWRWGAAVLAALASFGAVYFTLSALGQQALIGM
jgi:tetratricopeptide (TPR) repeat protein